MWQGQLLPCALLGGQLVHPYRLYYCRECQDRWDSSSRTWQPKARTWTPKAAAAKTTELMESLEFRQHIKKLGQIFTPYAGPEQESLFDIEVVFLYPWAVVFRELLSDGVGVLTWVLVFLGILELGLLYLWRKGGLEWD